MPKGLTEEFPGDFPTKLHPREDEPERMSMDNSEVLQLEDAQRLADRAVAKRFAVKGDVRFEHINESSEEEEKSIIAHTDGEINELSLLLDAQ
jgi:hypothetical protein